MDKLLLKPIHKKILLGIYLAVVFFAAVGFWYSPIIFKGNSVEPLTEEVVLARNFALTGEYAMENKLNVVLAPESVAASAEPSSVGNRFNSISFSLVFKLFGWQDWNNLVLINCAIMALSLVIFTLAVFIAFGWQTALIFPLVFILLPFNAQTAQYVVFMSVAFLYFSVFLLLFFGGRKRKLDYAYFAAAGVFLGLACLAREVFLVFSAVFFLWLLIGKKKKEILAIFIPVGLLLAVFWLPGMIGFGPSNDYAKLFITSDQSKNAYSDFMYYSHVYPDPYTYHFDRQRIVDRLNSDLVDQNASWLYRIDRLKVGQNMGVRGIGLWDRLVVGTYTLISHMSKFFAIEYIGGPLIFILMLYGFWILKERNRDYFRLFLIWLVGGYLIISYAVLAIAGLIMNFGFAIAALSALALADLPRLLTEHFRLKKSMKIAYVAIIALVLYSLILANHVYFGRGYDGNRNLCLEFMAQKVKEMDIRAADVIAIGEVHSYSMLNYLTGKAVVYFDPATVARLAAENRLQDAFDKFNVKYVIGFDAPTTDLIAANSSTTNIAVWPDPEKIASPLSPSKKWLLNLIK